MLTEHEQFIHKTPSITLLKKSEHAHIFSERKNAYVYELTKFKNLIWDKPLKLNYEETYIFQNKDTINSLHIITFFSNLILFEIGL